MGLTTLVTSSAADADADAATYAEKVISKTFAARTEHERVHTMLKPYPCRHEGCNKKAFADATEFDDAKEFSAFIEASRETDNTWRT
ncbi:hypothetical protein NFJ02_04g117350 [Pycnococcus provasolii]